LNVCAGLWWNHTERLVAPNVSDLATLEHPILAFIREWNEIAPPFAWTQKSFDKILRKCGSALAQQSAAA
jgi:hypothetical protein